MPPNFSAGDTAWLLVSAALVMLMTPGVAFFYGGMVRSKNVLNMLMMTMSALGVVTILWSVYGFSESFGDDTGHFIGKITQYIGLKGLIGKDGDGTAIPMSGSTPQMAFVAFQLMFAIITVALIAGAVADRLRFGPWLLFSALWATLVYFPVAHWVFDFDGKDAKGDIVHHGGWIANQLKAIDFAGGTAVHINSGVAGLVLAVVLGKRKGWPGTAMRPHNLPFVMLGAGLLWFGWYGFNAGSALTAGATASTVFVTTTVATAAAMLSWLLVEKLRDGHATSLGAASGVVAGLVAITPSCSSVNVLGALAIGAAGGAICAVAIGLKYKLGYDDALDVVGVHMVGGITGTLLVGLLAAPEAPAGVKGLFYGGGFDQLWRQAVGAGAVLLYSAVVTAIIALAIKYTIGLRAEPEAEARGLDESQHAESAYDFSAVGSGSAERRAFAEAGLRSE
ncbi:MAG: ammonium transporter [Segniliparus sp.]|uniref:ammonium transporter n=1 Tax=Segniliparus sp. TaxID=2804064 RepID=UPI003F401E66